jgi:hypothetical protein
LPTDNIYSSTLYNYSSEDKLIVENFLSYFVNFIKYDDPNYSASNTKQVYWQTFMDNDVNLEQLNAQQKLTISKYLVFGQNTTYMASDFSSHNCDFFGYVSSNNVVSSSIMTVNSKYHFLSILAYFFLIK